MWFDPSPAVRGNAQMLISTEATGPSSTSGGWMGSSIRLAPPAHAPSEGDPSMRRLLASLSPRTSEVERKISRDFRGGQHRSAPSRRTLGV